MSISTLQSTSRRGMLSLLSGIKAKSLGRQVELGQDTHARCSLFGIKAKRLGRQMKLGPRSHTDCQQFLALKPNCWRSRLKLLRGREYPNSLWVLWLRAEIPQMQFELGPCAHAHEVIAINSVSKPKGWRRNKSNWVVVLQVAVSNLTLKLKACRCK